MKAPQASAADSLQVAISGRVYWMKAQIRVDVVERAALLGWLFAGRNYYSVETQVGVVRI